MDGDRDGEKTDRQREETEKTEGEEREGEGLMVEEEEEEEEISESRQTHMDVSATLYLSSCPQFLHSSILTMVQSPGYVPSERADQVL